MTLEAPCSDAGRRQGKGERGKRGRGSDPGVQGFVDHLH